MRVVGEDAASANGQAAAPRRQPLWSFLFIAPCAAMALAAINLGAREPGRDAFAEGVAQMAAVIACAGSTFGTALLARTRLALAVRVSACAMLTLASAALFLVALPPAAPVEWHRVAGASGLWSVEFPGKPELTERTAPTPLGEMTLRESTASARSATFRVLESEPPGADRESAAALLARARADALRSGRERLLSEKPIFLPTPFDRLPGLELRFRLDGHDFLARIYAAAPQVYVLTAGPLEDAKPEVARFMDSFQLR